MAEIDSNHISELLAPGDAEGAGNTGKGSALERAMKRTELIARQDIYLAAPEELRQRRGEMRLGSRAFRELLRGERLSRIEEAQARKKELPTKDLERANLLETDFDAVDREPEAQRADPDRDPRGRALREELMETAATCVAWLEKLGFEADAIYANGVLSGMDRMRVSPGSKIWSLDEYWPEPDEY